MKIRHSPHHWIAVAIVIAVALLTLSTAHGQQQRTDAAATFQGRPAMAGAQGGIGAQAGPPQGGIGVQGSEAAERAIRRRPAAVAATGSASQAGSASGSDVAAAREQVRKEGEDKNVRDKDPGIMPKKKDSGVAKDERSVTKKAKRAAKRTTERARHGVSPIDSTSPAGR